jgi:uncharacterized MAPEG superfamily protein
MQYIELVAILTLIQLVFFGIMTGGARSKANLKAPATTGDEHFERMYRVQMNTVELIVILLPALLVAGKYWPPLLIAGLGVIYIIGRFIYWRAYINDPAKRSLGFSLSMLPILALVILALIGVIMAL